MLEPQKITENILKKVIVTRKSASHKGNYGHLLLIGGSENYGGAIIMATEGAINSGAGLTGVATHSTNLTALHARDPEAMYIDWKDPYLLELIEKMDVIVCGPGLGRNNFAKILLRNLADHVSKNQTVLLDADALDLISEDNSLLPLNCGHLILTPHQMEWQRLSQIRISFQDNTANQTALKQLTGKTNTFLVLKSNHTHVYDGSGNIFINPLGNPGMAIGGMGDTLAGIIGSFVAQFGSNISTVLAAVYLHSLAGDQSYKDNYVVKPTQLSSLIPKLMKRYANLNKKSQNS